MSKYKCLECGKEFGVGEWVCVNGVNNHIVTEKTFLTLDAPVAPGQYLGQPPIVRGMTNVENIPPAQKVVEGTDTRWAGQGHVTFVNGRFSTKDPQQQYWLERKGPAYNATEDQWKAVWWTSEERNAAKEMELRDREQRLENERNELLAQTQKRLKVPA